MLVVTNIFRFPIKCSERRKVCVCVSLGSMDITHRRNLKDILQPVFCRFSRKYKNSISSVWITRKCDFVIIVGAETPPWVCVSLTYVLVTWRFLSSTWSYVINCRTFTHGNIIQMFRRQLPRAANGVFEKKACLVCWLEEGKQDSCLIICCSDITWCLCSKSFLPSVEQYIKTTAEAG